MNLLFFGLFSRADTGLDSFFFGIAPPTRLRPDRIDFLSSLCSALPRVRANFSFSLLGTSLLATGIKSRRAVRGRFGLIYLLFSTILLDFFLLVLPLTDSSVGLLLNFLFSFFTVVFGTYIKAVLIMVDLLLFPSPPLLILGFNFRCDMFTRGSSSLSDSLEIFSSFFLALTAFLWRSVEIDRFAGICFFSSTKVFVRFLGGSS